MQMANPNFLVIGLDSGSFIGWNLLENSLPQIEAHKKGGIITMKKFGDYLISGDRSGFVQVRSISN